MSMVKSNETTILVVEDSKFTQDLIVSILEKERYIVVGRASNGKDAIRKYRELKPDIVTMDMNMPEMNGLQAIKELVRIDPDAKIIAITGYNHIETKARELGAVGFLAKPFHPVHLLKQVEEALALSKKTLETVESPITTEPVSFQQKDANPELWNIWNSEPAQERQEPEVLVTHESADEAEAVPNTEEEVQEPEEEDETFEIFSMEPETEDTPPDLSSLFNPIMEETPEELPEIPTEEEAMTTDLVTPPLPEKAPSAGILIMSEEEEEDEEEDDLLFGYAQKNRKKKPSPTLLVEDEEAEDWDSPETKEETPEDDMDSFSIVPETEEEMPDMDDEDFFEVVTSEQGESQEKTPEEDEWDDEDAIPILDRPNPEYYQHNPNPDEPLVIRPPADVLERGKKGAEAGTSENFELTTWDDYEKELGETKEKTGFMKRIMGTLFSGKKRKNKKSKNKK